MKKYQYKVQGVDYEVEIAEVEGKIARVNVNGIPFEIEMQKPINAAKHPALAATKRASSAPAGAGNAVKAPLPGTINAINVKVGDTVAVGDIVIVLEAMKMQNNIESEYAGTVTSITVNQGDSVMEGAVMMTIG